ncbi:MAG: hypothetical protein U0165_03585 [Polyangiaceae bacterium]
MSVSWLLPDGRPAETAASSSEKSACKLVPTLSSKSAKADENLRRGDRRKPEREHLAIAKASAEEPPTR